MLFQVYLPFKKEDTNDSSVRYSTVHYMVLAVLDVWANAKFVLLLKATNDVDVFPRAIVWYLF